MTSILEQKKISIRKQIKSEHYQHYFRRIRESKLNELTRALQLETLTEETILMQTHPQEEDFQLIYDFISTHNQITEHFAYEMAAKILSNYRTNQCAIYSLCLLLEKCGPLYPFLGEHTSELRALLEDNLQNVENLDVILIILCRVLAHSDKKESFAWLVLLYNRLVDQLGYIYIVIHLLSQASKSSQLLAGVEIVKEIAKVNMEGSDIGVKIVGEMLLRYFIFREELEYFGMLVIWVATQLEASSLTPTMQAILLQTLSTLFRLPASQPFIKEIVEYDHAIIRLLLLRSVDAGSATRALALECFCKIINSITDNLILKIVCNYSIVEPLARALELQLENSLKFDLLSTFGLLFQLQPEMMTNFEAYGVLRWIQQCQMSEFKQVQQMSCFIVDQFRLDDYC